MGVFLSLTRARNEKSRPSRAIAKIIRGSGNMEPRRLSRRRRREQQKVVVAAEKDEKEEEEKEEEEEAKNLKLGRKVFKVVLHRASTADLSTPLSPLSIINIL